MSEPHEIDYEQRFFQVQEERFRAIFKKLDDVTNLANEAIRHCDTECIKRFADKEEVSEIKRIVTSLMKRVYLASGGVVVIVFVIQLVAPSLWKLLHK